MSPDYKPSREKDFGSSLRGGGKILTGDLLKHSDSKDSLPKTPRQLRSSNKVIILMVNPALDPGMHLYAFMRCLKPTNPQLAIHLAYNLDEQEKKN